MNTQTGPKYLTVAETAKLVRAALRPAFPGQKFSVRSDRYAGGASIRVTYTDGPAKAAVEAVVGRYAGATFDGMTDMKEYHRDLVWFDGEDMPTEVHFGADFVFVTREIGTDYQAALRVVAEALLAGDANHRQTRLDAEWIEPVATPWRVFRGGSLWALTCYLAEHITPAQAREIAAAPDRLARRVMIDEIAKAADRD